MKAKRIVKKIAMDGKIYKGMEEKSLHISFHRGSAEERYKNTAKNINRREKIA